VSWTVRFTAEAERQAEALDPPVRRRIATRLAQLADNPKTAANVKALAGRGDQPV
jgi:mRNA-degrading endonuclease RelE of RelBE toxin-antitoxin system